MKKTPTIQTVTDVNVIPVIPVIPAIGVRVSAPVSFAVVELTSFPCQYSFDFRHEYMQMANTIITHSFLRYADDRRLSL